MRLHFLHIATNKFPLSSSFTHFSVNSKSTSVGVNLSLIKFRKCLFQPSSLGFCSGTFTPTYFRIGYFFRIHDAASLSASYLSHMTYGIWFLNSFGTFMKTPTLATKVYYNIFSISARSLISAITISGLKVFLMFCPMNFSNSEIFTESTILRNLFLVPHYLPLAICLLLIF